jgi:hypothetical protein
MVFELKNDERMPEPISFVVQTKSKSESEGLGGLSAAWYVDLATVGSGVKNIRLVLDCGDHRMQIFDRSCGGTC